MIFLVSAFQAVFLIKYFLLLASSAAEQKSSDGWVAVTAYTRHVIYFLFLPCTVFGIFVVVFLTAVIMESLLFYLFSYVKKLKNLEIYINKIHIVEVLIIWNIIVVHIKNIL